MVVLFRVRIRKVRPQVHYGGWPWHMCPNLALIIRAGQFDHRIFGGVLDASGFDRATRLSAAVALVILWHGASDKDVQTLRQGELLALVDARKAHIEG